LVDGIGDLDDLGFVAFGSVDANLELLGVDFTALLCDAARLAEYPNPLRAFGKFLDFVTSNDHFALGFEKLQRRSQLGRGLLKDGIARIGARRVHKESNDGEDSGGRNGRDDIASPGGENIIATFPVRVKPVLSLKPREGAEPSSFDSALCFCV
jgi:hypothetical protein